ncbi:hypothetical protein BCR33DRAFT_721118 [Rhizoclosmatium globosum]|uniref:Uncharacterized protein n=1 Tax=Rhizoclosmatium globosum TaxID=329046 RepID=A0A1Y2BT48_9FUNG|nr:hypothetical protein BCR33DRAFT_721118 [Rhizoclosmatium globosum]|eukprot:ORY37919.1 hypothetical protein BCR33DRAFT_721118 [Rhizoclosmatium globosum]
MLVAMIILNSIIFAPQVFLSTSPLAAEFGNILFAMFHILAMTYTWIRGAPIARIVIPALRRHLYLMIVLYAVLAIVEDALIAVTLWSTDMNLLFTTSAILQWLALVVGLVAVVFDLLVTGMYVAYLVRIQKGNLEICTRREKILCIYGVLGCFWIVLLEGSTSAVAVISAFSAISTAPPMSIVSYCIILTAQCLSIYSCSWP